MQYVRLKILRNDLVIIAKFKYLTPPKQLGEWGIFDTVVLIYRHWAIISHSDRDVVRYNSFGEM